MTASSRHETLLKAINDLAEEGGGETWRRKAGADLEQAWDATVRAIDALKAESARQLTEAVVAVMFRVGERQARRVLQGPPTTHTFQEERKSLRPRGYRRISVAVKANDGKYVERSRWVYDRDLARAWWNARKKANDPAAARRRQAQIARLLKQRSDLDAVIGQAKKKQQGIDRALAELGVQLFLTNGTLEAVTVEPQPWLVDADGQIRDQAWLPLSPAEEITLLLEEDGEILWMTLAEALRDHVWIEEETRDAWARIWHSVVAREQSLISAGLAGMRDERARTLGSGLPENERSKPRT